MEDGPCDAGPPWTRTIPACDVGTRPRVIGGLADFPGTQVNIRLPHAAGR